ncbi:chemotaxis protein CheA [Streptomyces sp. NP160]|uniref:chemotaxis protein CheA n=1 Tax=Streptomyces sp. NP160 TaxID=2586637 RepID=UPI00214D0C1E|nr:chemotaxis protein CheA [Streptomyces sp. NP160]
MDEIIGEFLVESYENLDQLDRDLVALEQAPGSRELLASVFRTIHTIKGTSGFLALSKLESVAHVGENLLAKLRDGVMVMDPATADALLAMVDTIRGLLGSLEDSGSEGDLDVEPTVAQIKAVLDGTAAPAAAPAAKSGRAKAPAAPEPVETVEEAPDAVDEHADEHTDEPVAEPAAEVAETAPAPAAAPAAAPVQAAEPAAKAAPAANDGEHRRSAADSSIRVDVDVLDDLMRLTGELVLARNQILRQVAVLTDDLELTRAAQRLNLIAGELQEGVMKTRMQPIDALWAKLPRVVRDLGAQCGRQVRLDMVGRETELDRTLLEAVKDPLTHLVRNAVDHGIEAPADRVAAGKPREGVLRLAARHESGQVVVEVSDDGKGIDPAVIGASAVRKGVITQDVLDRMAPADVLQLIFAPGFSTAAAVTNVSGRGVGMDVVKTNVEAIGGTIEVESVAGRGTTCRLRIPLTLAIMPALTVVSGTEQYAIPRVNLQELVALDVESDPGLLEEVGGAPVYRLRGELLPLVNLADVLGVTPSVRADGAGERITIAVLASEGRRFGLVVDRVLNTEEIVVKALGNQLKAVGLFSGATILGDGAVALILDVQSLARRALRGVAAERLESLRDDRTEAAAGTGERLLVAGIGGGRQVAIPLDMVTRLERIAASSVETVGSREVVQYRGEILPIVRLDRYLGAYAENDRTDLEVVVYADPRQGGRSVAIVVASILDVVDGSSASVLSDIDDHGLLGSAVIADRVTEMLDVRAAILTADPAFFSHIAADAAGSDGLTLAVEA